MNLEYEDYDSDSSLEDEEEQNIVKEKIPVPEYTEDELGKLLLFIQQIATCYELTEEEIGPSYVQNVLEWLHNITEPTLFVYFDQGILSAGLGCPLSPVSHVTYFIREKPLHMFTADGFFEEVSFGTFQENVDETMLHLMNKMFAPAILKDKRWSEEVKSKLFDEMHSFIAKLTDVSSRLGETVVLYVPNEGHDLSVEKASQDKALVKRYENVLIYWTSQINSCLNEQKDLYDKLSSPDEEQDFWIHKCKPRKLSPKELLVIAVSTVEILTGISCQIEDKNIEHILKVLRKSESLSIFAFDEMIAELTQEIGHSKSNSKFMKLLSDPFDDLRKSMQPKDIRSKLPKIIYLIRVISLNCNYYNDKKKVERLLGFVSNSLISYCTPKIELQKILEGKPRMGLEICIASIDCCIAYKKIFQRLVLRLQTEDFRECWHKLDEGKIFIKVDTFIQRLDDLMEICETIIVFSRKDETVGVPTPKFGGPQGEELTAVCKGLEKSFAEGLDKIKSASELLLDVGSKDWYPKMAEFKSRLASLDGIAKSLFAEAFTHSHNVEEALDSLTTLFNLSKRKTLQLIYEEKVERMWTMFENEILEVSKEIAGPKEHIACLPSHSGKAVSLHIKMKKCQRLHKLLTNAHYLPQLPSTDFKLKTYETTIANIRKKIETCKSEWIATVDEEPERYLKNFLITQSSSGAGLLDCNIHSGVLKFFDEARHFDLLELTLPDEMLPLNSKAKRTISVYNKVLNVVLLYNRILESLSKEERLLFRQHIKTMDKKVQPGIDRLNYGDAMTNAYITDCSKNIAEIQHFVGIYKIINSVFMKLFEKIAGGLILRLDIESVLTLDEFKRQFKKSRNDSCFEIGSIYKQVMRYMFLVYEGFEKHLTNDIALKWTGYIVRIDDLSEFAILSCARGTAQSVSELLTSRNSVNPNALIHMDVTLKKCQIKFEPPMQSLTKALTQTYDDIIKSVMIFPRLIDQLNCRGGLPAIKRIREFFEVVKDDKEFMSHIMEIDQVIEANLKATALFIQSWQRFRSLWETDNEELFSSHESNGMELEAFEKGMIELFDFESDAMNMDEDVSITYIEFNCSNIKARVLEYIESRMERYKEVLHATAIKKLEDFMNSMNDRLGLFLVLPTSPSALESKNMLHQQTVSELKDKLEDIEVIKKYFAMLKKYGIAVQPIVSKSFKTLPLSFESYKNRLDLIAVQLLEQKEKIALKFPNL